MSHVPKQLMYWCVILKILFPLRNLLNSYLIFIPEKLDEIRVAMLCDDVSPPAKILFKIKGCYGMYSNLGRTLFVATITFDYLALSKYGTVRPD